MQEPEKEGPSGLVVDLVRRVFRAPERSRGGIDATLTMCAAAVILSVGGWTRPGMDPFVLDARGFADEPWRLLSTHFVHVNIIHLWFNLSWIWFLGRAIEQRLGAPFLIGTSLFMMLGTSAVVQAFDRGGIGLSGVVYGMWAMIFVGQRRCEILRGILDARTNQLMVVWFFFCIIATMSGAFPVSNWGHGAGAVLGALAGLGIAEDGRMRPVSLPLASALLALLTCGATIWYPAWNFGAAAIELERSDALDPLVRDRESVEALYHSFERGDVEQKDLANLKRSARWLRNQYQTQGDKRSAFEWAQHVVSIDPTDRFAWRYLEHRAVEVGDKEWTARARTELAKLAAKR